ncbi:hypothetical protein [Streptomyces sp. NPDC051183]|uniref:hypothetical protein n=1 Tax=Streptomyces sp. NPDC051183 TaxID=3155165 RepID=UPI003438537B
MCDWITAAFGLGGTLIGAMLSFRATVYQQTRLAGERREAREGAAAAALAGELIRMRRHLAGMPVEFGGGEARDRIAWVGLMTTARESDWNAGFEEIFAPAEVAAYTLRHEVLRTRILDVLEILNHWWAVNAIHPGAMNKDSMNAVLKSSLEWLGAWQREEPIPAPSAADLRLFELWQQIQSDRLTKKRRGTSRHRSEG